MNHLLNSFLEISLYSSVIIIFIALLDKFTRKYYSSRWTYYIWLILAIRMLLPFNLSLVRIPDILPVSEQATIQKEFPVSPQNTTITNQQNGLQTKDSEQHLNNKSSSIHKDDLPDETLPSHVHKNIKYPVHLNNVNKFILTTIPYLWLIGIVIYMLRHIITYVLFINKINRWSMSIRKEETLQMLTDTALELNIQKPIALEICNHVFSPMMIGFLHPKIILPFDNYSETQMRTIIKHELIHYKHKDICYKFLLLCVNAIHWFNPLAYYMVNHANQTIELFCDESVISRQDEEYRQNYSYALLRTIEKQQQKQQNAFSTYFNGGKKLMKERFAKIMSNSPKKKGVLFFTIVFCLIVLTGFIAADSKDSLDTSNNNVKSAFNSYPSSKDTQNENNIKSTEIKTDNILFVGIDGPDRKLVNADSIMLLTIHPESKELTFTSFLRDMYVEIPDGTKNKLNAAYTKGGIDLLKETLEYNFGLTIDSTVVINYTGFENIIDLLGGAKVNLTEKEASYLNRTNYISKPENRNVSKGEQILNGNQALGYVRIRHVTNSNGTNGDMGRTERQRNLLLSLYEKCKSSDLTTSTILPVADSVLANVTTNLKKDRVFFYLNSMLEPAYTIRTMQIPVEGSYQATNKDGMSVLDIEITDNKNELSKLMQP